MPDRPLNRICYVEDDEDIQRIVRMSLERLGKMTVHIVGDPTMALDAMNTFKPDLVMPHWMMPKLDGRAARPRPAHEARRGRDHLQAVLAERSARAATGDLEETALARGAARLGSGLRAGLGPRLRARLGLVGRRPGFAEFALDEAEDLVGVAKTRIAVLL